MFPGYLIVILYDCPLTVNTQIHQKEDCKTQFSQVKQLKHFSLETALFTSIHAS